MTRHAALELLANLLLLPFCLPVIGPSTRSRAQQARVGYEPVCVGLVQPLNREKQGVVQARPEAGHWQSSPCPTRNCLRDS